MESFLVSCIQVVIVHSFPTVCTGLSTEGGGGGVLCIIHCIIIN